jgi:hypothetical protein
MKSRTGESCPVFLLPTKRVLPTPRFFSIQTSSVACRRCCCWRTQEVQGYVYRSWYQDGISEIIERHERRQGRRGLARPAGLARDRRRRVRHCPRSHAATVGVEDRIDFQRHDLTRTFPAHTFDLVSAQNLHSPVESTGRADPTIARDVRGEVDSLKLHTGIALCRLCDP